MLKQLFNSTQIAKVIRKSDVWYWDLWRCKSDKEDSLRELSHHISSDEYEVTTFRTHTRLGKTVYELSQIEDFLAVRLTDHYLRRIYKVKQSNRSRIIQQLKVILEDCGDLELRKLDITSFYESIDFGDLIEKIRNDMILGYKGLRILDSLHACSKDEGLSGLPRGIGVSATLSELYARKIDRNICRMDGVYFSARYVDDVIIISESGKSQSIDQSLKKLWQDLNLTINSKSLTRKLNSKPTFCYLGYEFILGEPHNRGTQRQVTIRIAQKKIKRQKTKISKAFLQYVKDKSFSMLIARLRYLTSNILISNSENGTLYAGNSFNYGEITNTSSLDVLDGFLRNIIHGRGRLGKLVAPHLSQSQIQSLKRISFKYAFVMKLRIKFTRSRSQSLKKVFRNV